MFFTGSRPVPPLDERSLGRRVSTGSLSLLRRRWRGPVLVALVLLVGGRWLVRFARERAQLSSGVAAQQSPTSTAHHAYLDKLVHDRGPHRYPPAAAGKGNMRGSVKQKLALVEGKRRDGELDEWERQQKLEASRTEPDKDAAKFMPDKLRSSRKKNAALPPFGAAIPDTAADDALCGARVADADEWAARFANGNPAECRLLVVAWVAESEANAQKHIIQLAALARRLRRTLVLPNVHRGAMGTCLSVPFDAYYDLSGGALVRDRDADRYLPDADPDTQDDQWLALSGAVSFAEFRSWAETRQTAPTAQIIEINDTPLGKSLVSEALLVEGSAHVTVDAEGDPANSTHPHCLSSGAPRLDFTRYSPLRFYPAKGERWHEKSESSAAYGHGITSGLQSEAANPGQRVRPSGNANEAEAVLAPTSTRGTPDVLVVSWGALHPILDIEVSALPPLGYAPRWTALAGSLVAGLGPFIAVHWRMEHIADDAHAGCASALIRTLLDLLAPNALGEDAGAVWLATDYPGDDPRRAPAGGAFVPGKQAQAAMRRVKAAFGMDGALERVRLTTLPDEMSRSGEDMDDEDDAFIADPGLMAIIDKSVAVRASIFVTGGTACGINSAFTKEIRDRRAHVIQGTQFKHDEAHLHAPGIRNLVAYFG